MKYIQLDQEEKDLLDAFERGEFVPVENPETAKREAMAAAKNTLNKTKNINIRLTERDLRRLKTKAIEEGIPYQTLAASILHKASAK